MLTLDDDEQFDFIVSDQSGSGPVGARGGISGLSSKPIYLPPYKKNKIDMGHILSGHSKLGGRATKVE